MNHKVYIVYGPPSSGKTTYINGHATCNDLVIDMDLIYAGISVNSLYHKPDSLFKNAVGVRDYLIEQVKRGVGDYENAYIAGGYPNHKKRNKLAKELNAELIFIDTPMEVCLSRCKTPQYERYIYDWFEEYGRTKFKYTNDENRFYHSSEWLAKREEVLKLDHHECQMCKAKGVYSQANTVHHVKPLRDRPDLALSVYDGDERQLISLCAECHNKVHKEKGYCDRTNEKFLTEERW